MLQLPVVTDDQNDELIQPITETEIVRVIMNGKTGRSPGSDGYTYSMNITKSSKVY